MIAMMLGFLGFVLFVLYDMNLVTWKIKALYPGFAAGCLCLAAGTIWLTIGAWTQMEHWNGGNILCLVLAALFFCLLIFTLFFAIPFHDTYQTFEAEPGVCDTGVYALCRHPGVLWFFFFYCFLGIGLENQLLLVGGVLLSICNLLYVILQDVWVFPKQFPDYHHYKKRVPFIAPTIASMKRCIQTSRKGKGAN